MTISARLVSIVRQFARRRFVRDTLILQFGKFVTILAQGLTNILILRILGPELVGIYTLIVAMAAVLGLLDLSAAGQVALVEVAKALGAGNHDEVRDNLAYYIRINLIINGILVAAFFVLAPRLAQISYSHDIENSIAIGLWARWLALLELTEVPFGMLVIAYQSQRNMRTLVSLESVRLLLTCAISIGVLISGWGIPGLVLSQVVISCAYAVYSGYQYSRLAQADPRFPAWSTLLGRTLSVGIRSRFWLGFRIAVDKNLGSFATQLPVLIMGALSPAALGYFSTALKVMTLPQPLISGITRNLDTFLPFRAGQGTAPLRGAFIRTTAFSGLIWSAVTIGMAVISPAILLVMAGFDYMPAIPLLYPLLLQSVAVGLGVGIGSTLRSLDKVEYSIANQLLTLALVGPLAYVLISRLGGYGAAWSYGLWSFAVTLFAIVLTLRLLRHVAVPPAAS
jgi:O-antigen/teichoic acid export membrane protein